MKRIILAGTLIGVLLAVLFACKKDKAAVIPVTRISLSETEVTLRKGDVRSLTVTLAPADATDHTVVWGSSNSNVVEVNDGLLTAVEVGTATIRATTADGRKRATCAVTVIEAYIPVESVMIMDEEGARDLTGTTLELTEGDTYVAIAAVRPGDATNQNVSWSVADPMIATVKNGTIKAINAGTTTLTITSDAGSKTASCTLKVKTYVPPVDVTGVTVNPTSYTFAASAIGGAKKIIATVSPADATTKDVRWSSSNTEVATVDSEGVVTAVAPGKATITVRTVDQGKTATCQIDVKGYVTGVNVNPTSLNLSVGATQTLTATVLPADAINKGVIWSSNHPEIAEVSETGVVTARAAGMATITVTTAEGNFTASCTVIIISGSGGDVNGGNEEYNDQPFNW